MNTGEICQRAVVSLRGSDEIVTAARLMRDEHVGYLVVVEPMVAAEALAPVGVLTDRDIVVAVVAGGVALPTLRVEDVMTRDPLVLAESAPIEDALRELRHRGVRRAPVVGDRGQLVGVISLDDLLSILAGELQDAAGSMKRGRQIEQALRR